MRASGRYRVLKAIGWSIAYLILGILLFTALYIGLTRGVLGKSDDDLPGFALVEGICEIVSFGLVTWLIGFKVLGLRARDLRWASPATGLPGMSLGLALGAVTAGLVVLLSIPLGGASFVPDAGNLGDYLSKVAITTLVLAPAALGEEIIFRGLPQIVLGRAISRGWALIAISVLFGLSHLFNPDPTPLAIVNITLAGVFLGVAFYAPGGIWTSFGAHLGWNATLAAFDAPVSGLPLKMPLIDYLPGGPVWLTGGNFGPEGGVLATIGIAVAIVVAGRWTFKRLETS